MFITKYLSLDVIKIKTKVILIFSKIIYLIYLIFIFNLFEDTFI
jgi:hypothetical protein